MKTWVSGLLVAPLLALTAVLAEAQQPAKIPRVGFLVNNEPSSADFESFRQGLRELGYIEGQNVIIEPRFGGGDDWRSSMFGAELMALNVDVIVAGGLMPFIRGGATTKTIPIVMAWGGDPVAAGFVVSRERPGGNITGIAGLAAGLGGKWLELLKETVPEIKRVGVLYSSRTLVGASLMPMKELEVTARSLRVQLQLAEARRPRDVGGAFAWATRNQADALLVFPSSLFEQDRDYVINLVLQKRLPGISWRAAFAEAGGLMAYGANRAEQFRRSAYFVDKILKGAKPAELPIELPKKFELTINLKTAKEIGITVPSRVLAWADKVIK